MKKELTQKELLTVIGGAMKIKAYTANYESRELEKATNAKVKATKAVIYKR